LIVSFFLPGAQLELNPETRFSSPIQLFTPCP
jgi:hypothetical protein